ncbi:hypothetical protein J5Y03_16580 [Bacillus sp. RG28]|uniref:Transposase n=1 Tax=Gottfriedia endophytica TaxID=2820819 RepID=A0A940NU23_9BACI|nr:phBC6A51 family helix-turn-helix protein [Gottfriedia endophytica]MBP0726776.1 hypothetical protein [Gottfriedia endophytica]
MKEKYSILDAKQEKAIIALINEPTITRAARAAGIGETTLYRWLQEEGFNKEYRSVRKQALSQTIARLQTGTTKAAETLEEVMDDKEASSSSRVTASKTVLEMAFKAYELEELASKMDDLEKRLDDSLK